jgi:hypothetical protein
VKRVVGEPPSGLSLISQNPISSKTTSVGASDISRNFGATIRVNMASQGLYLVIGRTNLPVDLLRTQRVQVLLKLTGNKLLALMPIASFHGLRSHPDIEFVGPVVLDMQRFNHFLGLIRKEPNGNGALETED